MYKRPHPLNQYATSDIQSMIKLTAFLLKSYRDDPLYIPSKSSVKEFRRIRDRLYSLQKFGEMLHKNMEQRLRVGSCGPHPDRGDKQAGGR